MQAGAVRSRDGPDRVGSNIADVRIRPGSVEADAGTTGISHPQIYGLRGGRSRAENGGDEPPSAHAAGSVARSRTGAVPGDGAGQTTADRLGKAVASGCVVFPGHRSWAYRWRLDRTRLRVEAQRLHRTRAGLASRRRRAA